MNPHQYILQKLNDRKAHGLYRRLRPESHLVDFCSNDYLGFGRSAQLRQMIGDEVKQFENILNGSTGSRLLAGNTKYAEELEHQIALYHGSEAGLIFNSGYDANLGLLSSLPQRGDTVIHDELIHASIIDGIRLSHANRYSFRHNDLDSLRTKLKQATGTRYVIVESIYSMDGDKAPLIELADLCEQNNAYLIVDEAHATGAFGKGLVNQFNIENKVFARIITFGKALGCHGAIVLGSDALRQYLINFARSFIYTTAAPLHQLASIKMAYQLLGQSTNVIAKLKNQIDVYRNNILHQKGSVSNSAIQTIHLGTNSKAVNAANYLQEQGFDVRAILSPTVPAGTERLRICLHAYNTDKEITELTNHLNLLTA